MNFVPVQSFSNYVEAHIAMGNLQQQNINCWLKDEYSVTIDPVLANAIGGIKLMVAAVQVPRAIELLQQAQEVKQPPYACPHCGSRNIQLPEVPKKAISWLTTLKNRLLGNTAEATTPEWHCLACGNNFEHPATVNTTAVIDRAE